MAVALGDSLAGRTLCTLIRRQAGTQGQEKHEGIPANRFFPWDSWQPYEATKIQGGKSVGVPTPKSIQQNRQSLAARSPRAHPRKG